LKKKELHGDNLGDNLGDNVTTLARDGRETMTKEILWT
jgi:hypothetical protein